MICQISTFRSPRYDPCRFSGGQIASVAFGSSGDIQGSGGAKELCLVAVKQCWHSLHLIIYHCRILSYSVLRLDPFNFNYFACCLWYDVWQRPCLVLPRNMQRNTVSNCWIPNGSRSIVPDKIVRNFATKGVCNDSIGCWIRDVNVCINTWWVYLDGLHSCCMANWAFAIRVSPLAICYQISFSTSARGSKTPKPHHEALHTKFNPVASKLQLYVCCSCARSLSAQGGNMKQRTYANRVSISRGSLLLDKKHQRQWDVHIPENLLFHALLPCSDNPSVFLRRDLVVGRVNCQVRVSKESWGAKLMLLCCHKF